MPDWEQFVGDRLGARFAAAHPEIVLELTGHLEEKYEDLRGKGLSAVAAERRALAQVSDWIRLRKDLERARQGDTMKNQQIRSVWLPGLVSAAAGFGLLRGILAFTGLRDWMFDSRVTELLPFPALERAACIFAIPWIAVLPIAGALGAFVSWRAGGRPGQRVVAALVPELVVAGTALLALPVDIVIGIPRGEWSFAHLPAALFVWILLPAVALTLGSLPLLHLTTLPAQRG